ncbi:MAG: PBP1A family penicillin-binding protein [Deltaproteobacteria bacterium]|nr:PBP1A family penicillin-binding protein [Deltaproteobacteria bacterium]
MLRWGLLGIGFTVGVLTGDWAVRLDATVRARFDGQRFRVPSRVLSAPTLLYPGLDWAQSDVRGTLARLGYQQAPPGTPLAPGHFVWGPERAALSLRAFEHPSRGEDAQLVELDLEGHEITALRDLPEGRERSAVQLEPETVGAYYGPDREQRDLVRLGEVPRSLLDAIIAVEDQRFDTHHGIDPFRIAGALWVNLRSGSITQGGSTLTQQLVKNFFLSPERTVSRKLQEAAMALIVELRYGKDEILECYLNEIYMGQRGSTEVHGVGEASRLYFGKPVRELTLAESATLAAVIPGPNRLSPFDQTERARARRNLVLDLMLEQGRIDAASHDAAVAEPLRPAPLVVEPAEARFFLDALRRQLPDVYDFDVLSSEGLEIYSTLDPRLQRIAARAVREGLAALEQRFPRLVPKDPGKALQACLVAVQPQTGQILALVGSRGYGESQFDRCTQAHRQAGSTFKPFVYIAALEPQGGSPTITLASQVDDEPLTIASPGAPIWRPANYDHEFHGRVPVREALERSMNVATARLAQRVGIDRVADVARRLGIESPLPRVPSLALGVADVTPLELARAYATLASGGIRPGLRTYEDIVDPSGQAIPGRSTRSERALDPGTAYLATSLLEGVVDRGTAAGIRNAGISGPIAGKTGTTDDEKDSWFVGFTPEMVAVVWVGFDAPRKTGLTGAAGALPIWIRFLKEATGGEVHGQFAAPPEVVQVDVDPRSGALATDGCPERRSEVFLLGTEPTDVCPEGVVAERDAPAAPKPSEARSAPPQPAAGRERGVLDWLRGLF